MSDQIHELAVFQFKDESLESQQIETMKALGMLFAKQPGFISRDFYYSSTDNRWIDHLVWTTPEAATAAVMVHDTAEGQAIFSRFGKSIVSRYKKIAE
jgi:hypothetical protein